MAFVDVNHFRNAVSYIDDKFDLSSMRCCKRRFLHRKTRVEKNNWTSKEVIDYASYSPRVARLFENCLASVLNGN